MESTNERERGYPSNYGYQGRSHGWRNESSQKRQTWHENASETSFEDGNAATVKVIVLSIAGASLIGPEELSRSVLIATLKERIRKARPGNGVKILNDTREMMDQDTLDTCSPAPTETLNLTAVLSKTYSVIVWGESTYGGIAARGLLEDGVLDLFGTSGAFAVIKEGGAVGAWGHGAYGGDMGRASAQLTSGVTTICAGQNAFVALKENGAAVAWGNASLGGRVTGAVAKKLSSGVSSITSSGEAFAALKGVPGEVVTWGQAVSGGDSLAVSHQLAGGVVKLYSTRGAFAALKQDGSVVTWGNPNSGGNSAGVSDQLLSGIKDIVSNTTSFAALKEGGRVVAWGNASCGGCVGDFANELSCEVIAIYSSGSAFAALKSSGKIITWGRAGQPSAAAELLAQGGIAAKVNGNAIAMVSEMGQVMTDGDARSGGDCSMVANQLGSGVIALASTQGAFAALKDDGSVVTWGRSKPINLGGDSSSVASSLDRGVLKIFGTQSAFAALKDVTK